MSNTRISMSDPFDYLEDDHKKVAAMLEKLSETTERATTTREEVFEQLKTALTLHADVEEQVMYPALEELKKTHAITMEAFEEHHVIKMLLEELSETSNDSEEWTAKLKVLKENVEHHVEEEEGDMFKKARAALSDEQIKELAEGMTTFLDDHM